MSIACGALFVLVTGTALRAIPDTAPESDHAVIDLQILEGVRGWQPVGMYLRFGWHHPGPLYFQALTPLYVVSGFRHTALIAGVVAINLISVVALIRIVTRRCTHIALPVAVCALFSIYFLRLSSLFARYQWTPHAALVPFGLLLCVPPPC